MYLALRNMGSIGYKRVVGRIDQNAPVPQRHTELQNTTLFDDSIW